MRLIFCAAALLGLTACAPQVPNSAAGVPDTGRGVGFDDYDDYQARREAQLTGGTTTVSGPQAAPQVQATPLDDTQARQQAVNANSGIAPVEASPSNPPPQVVENSAGISGENDFGAVSAQRDIASDAALIAQNRSQYEVIPPTDLPVRPGTNTPNVVEFALRTNNPVGTPLYKRGRVSEARHARACAGFTSADLAQEAFLAEGGPERDRKGMDPDGDGFACTWNPAPFRAARGG